MSGPDPHDQEHARHRAKAANVEPAKPKPLPKSASAAGTQIAPAAPAYSADERTHRDGLVQQLQIVNFVFQRHLDTGLKHAQEAMDKPDVHPQSELWSLLSAAASAAIVAASGGIASLLVAPLVETAEQLIVKAVIRKAVSSAFDLDLGPTTRDVSDLKKSYIDELDHHLDGSYARLATQWSATHDALHRLPTSALEALANQASLSANDEAATVIAMDQILVGWANFLARAVHGAMQWDPWKPDTADGGAIKLAGARDPWEQPPSTRRDTTTANVDPKAMTWALQQTQRPMMKDPYGILEIFLDPQGRLVDVADYGMRLDNVGPNVRKELRAMGRVRDLAVNKIVRMCSYRHNGVDVDPPVPIASILITADGYVRAHDWARFQRVHVDNAFGHDGLLDVKGNFGRCMDQLIGGQETAACHIDHKTENAEISAFAEQAQDLSLSHLKV